MIRAVLQTDTGPLIVLGVVEENLRRLRDAKPIAIDLGELLTGAIPRGLRDSEKLQLAIMYGQTHRAIVEEIADHVATPEMLFDAADKLDAQLRAEGLM